MDTSRFASNLGIKGGVMGVKSLSRYWKLFS